MLLDTITGGVKCFCRFDITACCWFMTSWWHTSVEAIGHSYVIFLTHLVFVPTGSNRNSASVNTGTKITKFYYVQKDYGIYCTCKHCQCVNNLWHHQHTLWYLYTSYIFKIQVFWGVSLCQQFVIFQRIAVPLSGSPSPTLDLEYVILNIIIWNMTNYSLVMQRHIKQDLRLQQHWCENFKHHKYLLMWWQWGVYLTEGVVVVVVVVAIAAAVAVIIIVIVIYFTFYSISTDIESVSVH